jgi:hypothetical protein
VGPKAVEHRQIVLAGQQGCAGRPTTSKVRVAATSPSGLESVRMILMVKGKAQTFSMTPAGDTWTATVGPYELETGQSAIRVTVLAMGKNGKQRMADVGEVCLRPCGR